jgi:hypothetical protein
MAAKNLETIQNPVSERVNLSPNKRKNDPA